MSSVKINSRSGRARGREQSGIFRPLWNSPQLRPSDERLRIRRRRVRAIAFGLGSFLALVVLLTLVWASHQPGLQIGKVIVTGNQILTEAEIAGFTIGVIEKGRSIPFSRSNLLIFPKQEIERALLNEFPRILSVEASLLSLAEQSMKVALVERAPYVRYCDERDCFLVDEAGLIFAKVGETKSGSVVRDEVFEGGIPYGAPGIGGRVLPGYFNSVLETVRALEQEGVNVVKVVVRNDQDFSMSLAGGAAVIVRFRDEPAEIVENFKSALRSEALTGGIDSLEYLDLRFRNRAYFKERE